MYVSYGSEGEKSLFRFSLVSLLTQKQLYVGKYYPEDDLF